VFKSTKIQNEAELDLALERIGELLRSKEGTSEFEDLQALTELVIACEAIHYPILDPSPTDWIQGRMDALGFSDDDLATHLGSMEVASGILAGEIAITPE
jgi:antitoxin component HigA of HigAB toxin-antitoxin module